MIGMPAVLFEGGTFRPVFSCGVMDALLDEDIMFPYCIGVSAGCADAASYVSRQRGRNIKVLEKYRNDKRYMGKRNLFKEKSMFGIQFAFRDIPNIHVPFDMETFQNYDGKFIAVTRMHRQGVYSILRRRMWMSGLRCFMAPVHCRRSYLRP